MALVTLSWNEAAMASDVGRRRQLESLRRKLPDRHGYDGDGWGLHIEGAMGEMAVAKFLGVYWDGGVNTFKSDDLPGLQVRTRSKHFYDLIVRKNDDPHALYVLVTGRCPQYVVHGFIRGEDAMSEQWMASHGGREPAYFIPKAALTPAEALASAITSPCPS